MKKYKYTKNGKRILTFFPFFLKNKKNKKDFILVNGIQHN